MTDTSIFDDTRIIRSVQTGGPDGPLTQGVFVSSEIQPKRYPPKFELIHEEIGTVELFGRRETGVLIGSYRNGGKVA